MKYQVVLEESEESFAVSVPSLPGCHSQGTTEPKALENIADAIREYLATTGGLGKAQCAPGRWASNFGHAALCPGQRPELLEGFSMDELWMRRLKDLSSPQLAILKKVRNLSPIGYTPAKIEMRSIDCLLEKRFVDFVDRAATGPREMRFRITQIGLRFLEGAPRTELAAMISSIMEEDLLVHSTSDQAPAGPTVQTAWPGSLGPKINQKVVMDRVIQAGQTGHVGEAIFADWLHRGGLADGEGYHWVSKNYAYAPYDFMVSTPWWEAAPTGLFVDVKATTGGHDGTIHMSLAEVHCAASHPEYRIARVSELGLASQAIRILIGAHELAVQIVDSTRGHLPVGVSIEGFEVEVGRLIAIAKSDGLNR